MVIKQPLVSIIVVTRNSSRFNKKFFDSLDAQTYKNFEVIAIDNISSDNTLSVVKKRIKRGLARPSNGDFGFSAANNLGAEEASGKYLFFLNHDAWIDEKCIESLVSVTQEDENNIYAPLQNTYDGKTFISCGIAADVFGYPARAYTKDGKKEIRRPFYADGAAFFLSKKNYKKVGMMDEDSYLYAEDTDLSWRCLMCGMGMVPVKDAVVYHYGGGSIGIGGLPKEAKYKTTYFKRYYAEKNIIRNIIKNYSIWNVLWVLPYYLSINLIEFGAMILAGQPKAIYNTYIKAYIWNIKNIRSIFEKRKHIQNIRVVSDGKIFEKMSIIPSKWFALLELGIPKINK